MAYKNDNEKESHPSYGMIGFSRTSGTQRLFASDFKHQHFITLRIREATCERNLSHSWYCARKELIEVALSESQFAQLISSLNVGDGVPCTLTRVAGELIPEPPEQETRKRFSIDVKESMTELASDLDKSIDTAKRLIDKPSKSALRDHLKELESVKQVLVDALPWIQQTFEKAMADTMDRAAIELDAMIKNKIMQAGLDKMGIAERPVLELNEARDSNERGNNE